MIAVLIFALALFAAVMFSKIAKRSVLSSSVLFLVIGFIGGGVSNLIPITAHDSLVKEMVNLALVSVLFTDGMQLGIKDLAKSWRLPTRALFIGMPVTFAILSLAAHFITGLDWLNSMLVGAILSPTDPVFSAAVVSHPEIPLRVRRMLSIESGLNDGLALPLVLILLSIISSSNDASLLELLKEVVFGIVLGIVVPIIAVQFTRFKRLGAVDVYQPLESFAVGIIVYALADIFAVNEYLAMFAAAVTIATIDTDARDSFHGFGETVTEILKLAAVMIFGALFAPRFFIDLGWAGYLFAIVALVLARPVGIVVATLGANLQHKELVTAAWFGPKGFSSVVYGLIVLESGIEYAKNVFELVGIVILLSIILHSSTDIFAINWFKADSQKNAEKQNKNSG